MSARSLTLPQYIDLLRPEYAMYKLPFVPLPFWVIWVAITVFGSKVFDVELLRCTVGKVGTLHSCSERP